MSGIIFGIGICFFIIGVSIFVGGVLRNQSTPKGIKFLVHLTYTMVDENQVGKVFNYYWVTTESIPKDKAETQAVGAWMTDIAHPNLVNHTPEIRDICILEFK